MDGVLLRGRDHEGEILPLGARELDKVLFPLIELEILRVVLQLDESPLHGGKFRFGLKLLEGGAPRHEDQKPGKYYG